MRSEGKRRALFGYTSLYGSGARGTGRRPRVRPSSGAIKVPDTARRDVTSTSPTSAHAWQAVTFADTAPAALACSGLGRSGSSRGAHRCISARGTACIGRRLVPERLEMAGRHGVEAVDVADLDYVRRTPRMTVAAVRTPSSTRSAWRHTVRPSASSPRPPPGCSPTSSTQTMTGQGRRRPARRAARGGRSPSVGAGTVSISACTAGVADDRCR